jgi:hypothetical protein
VESLQTTAQRAIRTLLAGQPTDAAKVRFAWRLVAGGPMGRATTASWSEDGVLRIGASSADWRREVRRSRPVLASRLQGLLGPGVVTSIVVEDEAAGP